MNYLEKNNLRNSVLSILFFLILIMSCAERERINIFDSGSTGKTPELNLKIEQLANGFTLLWDNTGLNDIDSIFIYKGFGSQDSMVKYISVPPNYTFYHDFSFKTHTPVFYSLSVFSHGIESEKIQPVMRIFGSAIPFILTYYGYAAYTYSYDLQEQKNFLPLNFPHRFMALNGQNAVFTSNNFDAVSTGSVLSQSIRLADTLEGAGPIAISSSSVYIGTTKAPVRIVKYSLTLVRSSQKKLDGTQTFFMHTLSNNRIFVATDKSFFVLDSTLSIMDSLKHRYGSFYDSRSINDTIYFLGKEIDDFQGIYAISPDLKEPELLVETQGRTFDILGDTIWTVTDISSMELVKQLVDGTRLLTKAVPYAVDDIHIAPEDKSIYVTFNRADKIGLYTFKGEELAFTPQQDIYDPIKVTVIP